MPHYTPRIDMQSIASNNPAYTASAQQFSSSPHKKTPPIVHKSSELHPQTDDYEPNSNITLARMEIELTDSNRDQTAKLPVDVGTSGMMVEAVTARRYDVGKAAVLTTDVTKQNENIVNGKIITSIGADEPTKRTEANRKDASIDGLTEAGTSSAPRPRLSAILVESSDAPPDLPEGWTSKTFARANSDKKASDTYFYSVQNKIKFRSMKACKAFIQILEEPAIGGSESVAFKEFKLRGYKL
jgi:hypothetical protein